MSHFYDLQGNTAYEVERSDGKGLRPTTIADARKLNLVPSVTTVMNIAAKPGLEIWKTKEVLKAAYKNRNTEPEYNPLVFNCLSYKEQQAALESMWSAMILKESKQIGEETAKRGTEIHNKLEEAFLQGVWEDEDYVTPAIEILEQNPEIDLSTAIPERSFAHPDGFGGKVDLSGKNFIVDFKTKNKEVVDKKCVTDEHCMQIAAYRKGLDLKNAKCYNLYISAIKPGQVYLHEYTEKEVQRGEEMFNTLLKFWQLSNKL